MILENGLVRTMDSQIPTQRALAIAPDLAVHALALGIPGVEQALKKFALGGSALARFGVNAGGTLVAETAALAALTAEKSGEISS